jgi:hypothetical protein
MNQATFSFNKWNTILGWVTGTTNLYTYRRTYNELWDCGEYVRLLQNYKWAPTRCSLMEMIIAFFAMFADNEHIALMVNMTSVFSGAFTILFLLVFINNS